MEKIYIETHSGKTFLVEVENFDSVKFNEDQNNPDINSIEIGGLTRSRVDIKGATPEVLFVQSGN
jgi:hypothetical protein